VRISDTGQSVDMSMDIESDTVLVFERKYTLNKVQFSHTQSDLRVYLSLM